MQNYRRGSPTHKMTIKLLPSFLTINLLSSTGPGEQPLSARYGNRKGEQDVSKW